MSTSLFKQHKYSAPSIPTLAQAERAAIETALAASQGHIGRAAALLDIAPSTIYRKINGWVAAPSHRKSD